MISDAPGLQVALFAGLLTITVSLMLALGPLIVGRTFAPSRRATSASTRDWPRSLMGSFDEMTREQGRRSIR